MRVALLILCCIGTGWAFQASKPCVKARVAQAASLLMQESADVDPPAVVIAEELQVEADSEEAKLSPMARMRKEQALEKEQNEKWLTPSLQKTQAISRVVFGVLVAALAFAASQIDFAATREASPPEQSFELPISLPSLPKAEFRTGYEDRTDIGTYRPLFTPSAKE